MKLIYNEFGRLDEIQFAENDNQEAFWESFKEISINAQKETTKQYEIYQKENTNRCEISNKHYLELMSINSLQRLNSFGNMRQPPQPTLVQNQ